MIRTHTLFFIIISIVFSAQNQSTGRCPVDRPRVECLVEPCSLPAPQNCNFSYCVDDYCGGCNRHYYAENGSEVCIEPASPTARCRDGTPIVNCLVQPCSLPPPTSCNYSYCVDDYCGGCNRHYYAENGSEVCTEPASPTARCPDGTPIVNCLVQPCSLPPPNSCNYSYCVDDYCGGCNRHYYAENGSEVCTEPASPTALCPDGTPIVNCLVQPCSLPPPTSCNYSYCVDDYCGGCFRHYFDGLNRSVCNEYVETCSSNDDCSNGKFCNKQDNSCSSVGVCENPPVFCTRELRPVCGCDGRSYNNPCLAKSNQVNIAYYGYCPIDKPCSSNRECISAYPNLRTFCQSPVGQCSGNGTCRERNPICTQQYQPVCGCDRKTYSNPCFAYAAGVNVISYGPCRTPCSSNSDCLRSEFCGFPSGQCSGNGICSPKPEVCLAIYNPVCGCDGKTYSNGCEASVAGVNVLLNNECPASTCTSNSNCRRTEFCHFPEGECSGVGVCSRRGSFLCNRNPTPVCGCDRKTYTDPCKALNRGINIQSQGRCPLTCRTNNDCRRISNTYCSKPAGRCNAVGTCQVLPELCNTLFYPVCGCDGRTYSNQCYASRSKVNVARIGSCLVRNS